ncbi:RdgB/HAM1 family non-canonical purine NTP pyrophosphatase [Myxococcota bacterium]|nr:RdgB/HAM1 family non-canonical purine NTP pyrophosphatase [Myxococcota bacterium]MBU1381334.1 RdgB/HAM1 family non-canonical purine NTP pyrophosphatase [Myxococcota bacterium]MBU1495711.1 RdgB/HAM1 family non-canonical purine NTP pyrophosphatase [Myxococcota bacterium]
MSEKVISELAQWLKRVEDHPSSLIRNITSTSPIQKYISEIEETCSFPERLRDESILSETGEDDISSFYDEDMLKSLLEVFQAEAYEHIESLAEQLDAWPPGIFDIYRTFHTIKGAAATVGLTKISRASKLLEDVFHSFADTSTVPEDTIFFLLCAASCTLSLMVTDGSDLLPEVSGIIKFACSDPQTLSGKPVSTDEKKNREKKQIELSRNISQPESLNSQELPPDEDTSTSLKECVELDEMTLILMEVFSQEAEEHLSRFDSLVEELQNGNDVFHELFRVTHTLKGAAATVGVNRVSTAAHKLEDFFEKISKSGASLSKNDINLIFHMSELLRRSIEPCDEDVLSELDRTIALIGKNNGTRGEKENLNPDSTESHGISTAVSSEDTGKSNLNPYSTEINETVPGLTKPRGRQTTTGKGEASSSILRIRVDDIDKLINSSEELVHVRTQIEKSRDDFNSITGDLLLSHHTLRHFLMEDRNRMNEAERLERLSELEVEIAELIYNLEHSSINLTRECVSLQNLARIIQERLITLRITNFEILFIKLKQSIRENAFSTFKNINIILEGQNVEVDKGVVDSLSSPLLQIARNAVAHGIEGPQERLIEGKPPDGTIRISAVQEGYFAKITFEDDGRGIDFEQVKSILAKKKFISTEGELKKLTKNDLYEAIFLQGFTTKETADSLSGRGVGLDLVREKIRKLGGDISVESITGAGTKFIIRVPLTTFVSKALLFTIGNEVYGVPSTYCIEVMEHSSRKPIMPGARLIWKSESIPVVPLHYYFGIDRAPIARTPYSIIVLQHGEHHFAIAADATIGIKDVTVKPLGKILGSINYFNGAVISGAGTIQMILSVPFLASLARPTIGFHKGKDIQKHISAPRILVCDDSKSVREAAARIIAGAGYEVTKVQDGWEAWNILHNELFNLVLTDLEMPRMTGWELISEIKRDVLLQNIPVVVLSSRTGETSRDRAMDAGANYFVSKPIKPLILLRVLEQFIPLNESTMSNRIVLFATQNRGKILELSSLMLDLNLELWGMEHFPDLEEVVEDGASFEENAIKKARTRCIQTGLPCIADDSGLEVNALDGAPGILSARYAGEEATDQERINFLLNNMKDKRERTAQFVSVIAFIKSPSSEPIVVKGVCKGSIGYEPIGSHGFGYDPVFILPDGKTMAELTMEEKNEISHRAKAFKKLLPYLEEFSNIQ